MDVCKACAIAKAKQKNTQHKSQGQGKASAINEKVYSDLSYIYGPDQKCALKYIWHLMIDSATGLGTDCFYKAKMEFIELACKLLQKWKSNGNEVKILCQDSIGKNELFDEHATSAN